MSGYAGGTAAADVARLRRMVAESGTAAYSDALLVAEIARHPLPDITGEWPYLTSGSANTDWTGTYDLAAAAAAIWEEKATGKADFYSFTADGATFQKQQVYEQYNKEARKWRSRRAVGSHTIYVYPAPTIQEVFNINDPYE